MLSMITFSFIKLFDFVKGMRLKDWLILICIIAIGYSLYLFHEWSFIRGMSKQAKLDQEVIARLMEEKTSLQEELDVIHQLNVQIDENHGKALEAWKLKEADLQARLNNAVRSEARIRQQQRSLTSEIPKLIPSHVDHALPNGFVWLYNESVQTDQGTETTTSDRTSGDAGASSAIAYTQALSVMIENHAECVYRGELIKAWQDYYRTYQEMVIEYQKQLDEGISEKKP